MSTRYETPQSICRFGIAIRDITPPPGIYHRMWGAARHDRSAGVHRPLRASALAFGAESGDDVLALIAIDHCLFFPAEVERFTARLSTTLSLPREALVITCSHTHGAGLMDPERADLPGGELIEAYLEELGAMLVEALRDAIASTESATITYARGRCALARHRDFRDPERGDFVCGFNPHRAADDTVWTARVTRADGSARASLVNYACHPTTLAWDNELVSPDYPGAMRELVESATGAPCVFLQGASGELGPRDGFVGDTEVADRNGRELGYAALAALESMPPPRSVYEYEGPVISGATIGIWRHRDLDAAALLEKSRWRRERLVIELPYREGLESLDETEVALEATRRRERDARASGRDGDAATERALAERLTRQARRLAQLPPGARYPYHATLWRIGDAVWIAVEGEPYSLLQTELRQRFPALAIMVLALSDGWGPSYLPTRETFGQGIYQEQIAVLEAGCLEQLIEALAQIIARVNESASP